MPYKSHLIILYLILFPNKYTQEIEREREIYILYLLYTIFYILNSIIRIPVTCPYIIIISTPVVFLKLFSLFFLFEHNYSCFYYLVIFRSIVALNFLTLKI